MGGWYRVAQFLHAMRAHITEEECEWARSILPAEAWTAFQSLPIHDQRHGLDVAQALAGRGAPRTVLAAALLHDAGKAEVPLSLIHRSAIVLLQAISPALLQRLGAEDGRPWRRPFWTHLHHGELGAQLAGQAGCDELTVWLIRHHHTPAADIRDAERRRWLEMLQEEDNRH